MKMKISLQERRYNGCYGEGSVFVSSLAFDLNDSNKIQLKYYRNYCVYENIFRDEELIVQMPPGDTPEEMAEITFEIDYVFSEPSLTRLKEIIFAIKNTKKYLWNENHYNKNCFDTRRYSYFDVTVNEIEYELPRDDSLLEELLALVQYNAFSNAVFSIDFARKVPLKGNINNCFNEIPLKRNIKNCFKSFFELRGLVTEHVQSTGEELHISLPVPAYHQDQLAVAFMMCPCLPESDPLQIMPPDEIAWYNLVDGNLLAKIKVSPNDFGQINPVDTMLEPTQHSPDAIYLNLARLSNRSYKDFLGDLLMSYYDGLFKEWAARWYASSVEKEGGKILSYAPDHSLPDMAREFLKVFDLLCEPQLLQYYNVIGHDFFEFARDSASSDVQGESQPVRSQ